MLRLGALVAVQLLAFSAMAEPIHLKLAFYEDRGTAVFMYGIKPFVDSVNAEGTSLVQIDVYPDGALGAVLAEQPRLVLDGTADIAFVIPGQTPYRFPDNRVLELPGLFRDLREATLAYTHLVAGGELRGYENYFVIGTYTTSANTIYSRKPIGSLDALKGQKIRANNQIEAAVPAQRAAVEERPGGADRAAVVEIGVQGSTSSASCCSMLRLSSSKSVMQRL